MWVIDVGRIDIFAARPRNLCPPKLVIIDLTSGRFKTSYTFPERVPSPLALLQSAQNGLI